MPEATKLLTDSEDVEAGSPRVSVQRILRFLRLLWRNKLILLGCLAITCGLGAFKYLTAPRVYAARASLLLQRSRGDTNSFETSFSGASQDLKTYQELLTTDVVLNAAVTRLEEDGSNALDKRYSAGKIRGMISAGRVGDANILQVVCQSEDPQATVTVLNAVVDSYLDFIDANHKDVAVRIVETLDKERTDILKRIDQKSQALLVAKQRCGDLSIGDADETTHPVVQRAVKTNEALLAVQRTRVQLQSALAGIRQNMHSIEALRQYAVELEPILGSGFMQQLVGIAPVDGAALSVRQRQIVSDEMELATLRQHYGPSHSKIVELTNRIRQSKAELSRLTAKIDGQLAQSDIRTLAAILTERVARAVDSAQRHEAALQEEYVLVESDAIELNGRLANVQILQRDLERLRQLHESLLNRIASIDINQNQSDIRASVVRDPVLPRNPVSPRLSKTLLLSLIAGFGIGAGIIFVRDLLEDRFDSPEQLSAELRLPVMAIVRDMEVPESVGAECIPIHASPQSVECEAFRTLRTAVTLAGHEYERLAVTSAEPSDGKTLVLANLATAYAQAGKRTLLIDADMRKPGLSRLFDLRRVGGLSEVLRSSAEIDQMCSDRVKASGIEGLDVLPCGPKPSDPAELLSRDRLEELIAWADKRYDQILIDCPPVLAASDAALVGRRTDGTILVVQPPKNHRRLVLRAEKELRAAGVPLIGIVANRINNELGSEYGFDYGYGYGYGDTAYGVEPELDEHVQHSADRNETTAVVLRRAS